MKNASPIWRPNFPRIVDHSKNILLFHVNEVKLSGNAASTKIPEPSLKIIGHHAWG
ncbi:hypothetical protein [Dyadobacter pollutisoli]|uniref:Uncharacterized protein n=1 Tax=Dyadobacter pollutisoli TaxID=2910158 RepID=A0A9E8NEK3_9BACT|nr:hypothetical protein [Dyadobacter pollutisoli]WAC13536.1 hypothetical protein ON006_06180 [Dyadobacter pollutisoli]